MKNYIIAFVFLSLISCKTQNIQTNSLESLKVNDIASKQLSLINEYSNSAEFDLNAILIDSIYTPNKKFWNGYLGDDKAFLNWYNESGINQVEVWNKNAKNINPALLTSKLNEAVIEMYKFTGYVSKGEWNIIYGPAWTDLGGFNDGTMLIDLAHKANDNKERIIRLYPHELNHQIYSNTFIATEDIVLNRVIDEGFATYVSYIFHNKKYSIPNELLYTDEEYKFCKENEKELLQLLKENYNKSDEDLSRKFANRGFKFKENYPGAIGYYLGFRIIEEFVKENGKNSWKDIYTMNPKEVLNQSKLLK